MGDEEPKKDPEPGETEPGEKEPVEGEPEMIQKAKEAAEKLEEQNKRLEKNLDRQERLRAEEALGGIADAGSQEKSQEEKEVEDAKKLIEGSGFEDMAFPTEKTEKKK